MELFAPRHLLIILLICLLVFGTKKLKTIGADLGGALKGFKQAMKEGESIQEVHSESAESLNSSRTATSSVASAYATTANPAASPESALHTAAHTSQ